MHEYKITASEPIQKLPSPQKISIALSQHIGAPCTPTVKVGDQVFKGQIVGVVEKGLGCPVHSSVSGKVTAIDAVLTPQGRKVGQIIIESDGEDKLDPSIKPFGKAPDQITPEECIEAVARGVDFFDRV